MATNYGISSNSHGNVSYQMVSTDSSGNNNNNINNGNSSGMDTSYNNYSNNISNKLESSPSPPSKLRRRGTGGPGGPGGLGGPGGPDGRRPRIHWRYPAAAVFLFVASAMFAVGHDQYYARLNGSLADTDNGGRVLSAIDAIVSDSSGNGQQTWALRIGTGLAFLNKTALGAVVGLVAAQQVWFTLRRSAMTVDGIDSMFEVLTNPLALLHWDLLVHAKVLLLVAVVSWCLPLASVVTPATLSVTTRPLSSTVLMGVPALNFSDDSTWSIFEGVGRISGVHFDIATFFSSVYASTMSSSSSGVIPISPAPFPNASYDRTLYGPSYKCTSLSEALANGVPATWTIDNPVGSANTTFATFEEAFYGELEIPLVYRPSVIPTIAYSAAAPSYMFNMLLISTSGVNPLWDRGHGNGFAGNGSDVVGHGNGTFSSSGNNTGNGTLTISGSSTGSNIVCQLYNTSFDVTLVFENGVQTVVTHDVQLLEPQAYSGTAGTEADVPFLCRGNPIPNNTVPAPSSNGNCSQANGTYYVTHLLFSSLVSAMIQVGSSGGIVTTIPDNNAAGSSSTTQSTPPLLQSTLLHCPDVYNNTNFAQSLANPHYDFQPGRCRNGTLAAAIEDLSRNFTYSLLAFDGWANYSQAAQANVTHTESRLFFVYQRATLWGAYAAAMGTTLLIMLAVGVRALWHNGVVSSTAFSSTLLTTRNPQLDAVLFQDGADAQTAYTRSVGTQPVDSAVGQLRLRFGYIDGAVNVGGGAPHAGFGLEGTVRPYRENDEQT